VPEGIIAKQAKHRKPVQFMIKTSR